MTEAPPLTQTPETGSAFARYLPLIRAADGLTLAQVCSLTSLEPTTIQNWIKRGFVPHPVSKKYRERHIARIMLIASLRECMLIERVGALMTYINGNADDEADDIISDVALYDVFCRVVRRWSLWRRPVSPHDSRKKPTGCIWIFSRRKTMNNTVTTVPNIKWKKILIPVIILVVLAVIALNAFTIVDAGHTGVVTTFGKVNEGVLQEGIHFKLPFIQQVVMIDNRIQKLEVNTEAFSKDLQSVNTVLAINYRVDTSKSYSIYKNIGADYENVLVVPAVNEVLKAITATYTAEESVTNRQLISDGLVSGLNEKLNDIGLYVTDVNIIDFDFSEAFITAIEEKQVAQQQLLKAETEKKTKITNAQADAEAQKIRAEGEAEANKTISQSLTDQVIENKKIEKWNGELPKVSGGAGTFVDIGVDDSASK